MVDNTPGAPLVPTAGNILKVREDLDPELEAFYTETSKDGKELISASDIIMPRIALIQKMSPQVDDRVAVPGDFYNTVSRQNYGPEPFKFVPLLFYGSRIKWESKNPGSKIECVARTGEIGTKYGPCVTCRFSQFNADGTPPDCTDFKNILAIPMIPGENPYDQPPAAISGKSMSLGPVKDFLTRVNHIRINGRPVAMYAYIWKMTATEASNEKGKFYVPMFDPVDRIIDIELLKYLRGQYDALSKMREHFVIDEDQPVDAQFTERSTEFNPRPETESNKAPRY